MGWEVAKTTMYILFRVAMNQGASAMGPDSLEGPKDVSLPLESIPGPYFPFGALHGVHCLSCNLI